METDKNNLYARWLEGNLSPEESSELKTSGELEELEAIIKATDKLALPKYDATAGYAQFKANRPSKKPAKVRSIKSRKTWTVWAAAASVAILISTFWLINSGPDVIETGNQLTLSHTFSDQTNVVLNDGSTIFYDESDWDTERTIKLVGEAIFNVEKGKPFIVNTDIGTVRVLGTSFNVRAWSNNLNVECYEGRVSVQYGGKEEILNAGESVNGILGNLENKQSITHQKPLWSTGASRFHQEPVNQVFKELERQFDITVISPNIERPFNGSFQHNNLETALKSICLPMDLEYSFDKDGKEVVITTK